MRKGVKNPMKKKELRHYLMALFGKRRTPIRVAKADRSLAFATATEWWEVTAPTAKAARALCMAWPSRVVDGESRITNHGRKRT
jgi:hypothetical protein